MSSLKTLEKLLIHELKDLYSAESQITRALPKMMKAASSPQLKEAFQTHLEQTKAQIERLNEIARIMGQKEFKGQKCKGMEGLVEEGNEIISEGGEPAVVDAALIGAAQKVEHYEIATYGTARAHARHLGLDNVVRLLQETLDEEGMTDKLLTKLAQRKINLEAEQEGGTNGQSRSRGSSKSGTTRSRSAMPRSGGRTAGRSRTRSMAGGSNGGGSNTMDGAE